MKIGIDGRALQGNLTGVGRYVYELCRGLNDCLPDAEFYVYSNRPVHLPIESERWIVRIDNSAISRLMKPILWLKTRCGELCEKDNIDSFWGTATLLPKFTKQIHTASTVYDLTFKIAPRTMTFTHYIAHRIYYYNDVMRADKIIAISEGTKKRLFELTGKRADGVIKPAVGENFRRQGDVTIDECLKNLKIEKPFILAVATWEPRKNLGELISAFLELKEAGALPYHTLVLAGGRGWEDARLLKLVKKHSGKKYILPLGFVQDKYLPALYSACDVFVFPSLYEGFGIPLIEARSCGAKIVASDTIELREAGGNDAIYISPDINGIKEGILAAIKKDNNSDSENAGDYGDWGQSAILLAEMLTGKGDG